MVNASVVTPSHGDGTETLTVKVMPGARTTGEAGPHTASSQITRRTTSGRLQWRH